MLYFFLWFFIIYAFLGWCSEVAFAAFKERRFVNRGFLNGVVCPIYGFGVVIVILILTPLRDNLLMLFFGSVLLTSALEWLTGFVLEKVFHNKWWDYSDMPLNLNGYVCLRFSLMWGVACVFIMTIFHPLVYKLVDIIPIYIGRVFLAVFYITLLADSLATITTIMNFNRRLKEIDEIAGKLKLASNEIGENISEDVISMMEKGERIKENIYTIKEGIEDRKTAIAMEVTERKGLISENLKERKENILLLREKYENLLSKRSFSHKRLLKAFPTLEELKKKLLGK